MRNLVVFGPLKEPIFSSIYSFSNALIEVKGDIFRAIRTALLMQFLYTVS